LRGLPEIVDIARAANMAFQLVARRYERGSILLTSNKAFSEWGSVFGDDVLASAILDRLLHHCDVISINGAQLPAQRSAQALGRRWSPGVTPACPATDI
jgi:DNA replication protein DnaC